MRQRHTAQMKDQIKTPEKELNKMEASKLLDAEFKTLVIRMLSELSENLNSIKKDQSENQDGGVGRHTAPPCTTRTDRKSNGKEVRHQGNKK